MTKEVAALVEAGVAAGHKVMVTPIGPAFIAECSCRTLGHATHGLRRASKHQANQAGIAHLRRELDVTP